MEGPDLSHVGLKGYKSDWYVTHLQSSQEATDGVWRNSFREISEADQAALKTFLDTLMGAPTLIQAKAQFKDGVLEIDIPVKAIQPAETKKQISITPAG